MKTIYWKDKEERAKLFMETLIRAVGAQGKESEDE